MQRIHIHVRRLNPYSRNEEPLSEIVFSDVELGKTSPQPRRCVTGTEPLKRFFEEEVGQSAANTDALLQKLKEEL